MLLKEGVKWRFTSSGMVRDFEILSFPSARSICLHSFLLCHELDAVLPQLRYFPACPKWSSRWPFTGVRHIMRNFVADKVLALHENTFFLAFI